MGKKRISVESIKRNPETTHALVVVWEKQKVEGETQEVPIGEKQISFSSGLHYNEMLPFIKQAAQEIVAEANAAKATREQLNRLLEKESVE